MKHGVDLKILFDVIINPWSRVHRNIYQLVCGKKIYACVRKIGVPAPLNTEQHYCVQLLQGFVFGHTCITSFMEAHTCIHIQPPSLYPPHCLGHMHISSEAAMQQASTL